MSGRIVIGIHDPLLGLFRGRSDVDDDPRLFEGYINSSMTASVESCDESPYLRWLRARPRAPLTQSIDDTLGVKAPVGVPVNCCEDHSSTGDECSSNDGHDF